MSRVHVHKKCLHKARAILHCDTRTDWDRLLLHVSRNATEREQVGSPWSPRAMLSTYRVICINTDNFSHDSVRLILLQRMFSGSVTMDRNNVHHRQNKILAFAWRSSRFIYRIPTPAVRRFNLNSCQFWIFILKAFSIRFPCLKPHQEKAGL